MASQHIPVAQRPVDGATKSFWRHEPHPLDGHQSSLELPARCDVLIIGGGFAGVATAYHLLKATPASNIVMLEAREACSGATGRNGGHLRPNYIKDPARFFERYGPEAASDVLRFERAQRDAIKRLIQEENIECDLVETTSFEVFNTLEEAAWAKARYDLLCTQPSIASLLTDIEFYQGPDARQRTGIKEAKAYIACPAAHLWPYKLVMGLLSRALRNGLCMKTNTPALSIDHDSVSGMHRITTSDGNISAQKIIIATNAYTSTLLPEYAAAIVPCRGLACHISSPNGTTLPQLPTSSFSLQLNHGRLPAYNYLIQRTDGTIVVGGAHHTYKPDTASWYNNVDDSTLIDAAGEYFDGFANRTFEGWEAVPTQVDYAWTGIMGYSADTLPHIGPVPSREGVFVLAGFNGHGMSVIYLAAKAMAEMVAENKAYEETGLPVLYSTSRERLTPRFDDILGEKMS